jgi:hypothetical protein
MLLIDLHLNTQRQGPGSEAHTQLAMQLAGLDRNGHSADAQAVVDETLTEIQIFERYSDWFSYGVFVAER